MVRNKSYFMNRHIKLWNEFVLKYSKENDEVKIKFIDARGNEAYYMGIIRKKYNKNI